MTRKDYELIARVIRSNIRGEVARLALAQAFGMELERTYDRFDYDRFIEAATKEGA